MNPALWGAMTAIGWGSSDFIARFTGRTMGAPLALFGMLLASALIFSQLLWLREESMIWDSSGFGFVVLFGLAAMTATGLLFWGLARGPVTVVAPLAGSYPVFNVAFALVLGDFPTATEWIAMAAVISGVWIVARSAASFEGSGNYDAASLRLTILGALLSALLYAVTVAAAQETGRIYGELQAVWMARWVSIAALTVFLAWKRERPNMPLRWWPLLLLQGILDGVGYMTLAASGAGPGGEIGAVVASTFGAVTVVLGRVFLREPMTWLQWSGILCIIGGVATLA